MDQPTILVVEDNPDHVAMIEAVFARGLEHARIHVAFRGQGAKRYLRGQWVAYEDDVERTKRRAISIRQRSQRFQAPGAGLTRRLETRRTMAGHQTGTTHTSRPSPVRIE